MFRSQTAKANVWCEPEIGIYLTLSQTANRWYRKNNSKLMTGQSCDQTKKNIIVIHPKFEQIISVSISHWCNAMTLVGSGLPRSLRFLQTEELQELILSRTSDLRSLTAYVNRWWHWHNCHIFLYTPNIIQLFLTLGQTNMLQYSI